MELLLCGSRPCRSVRGALPPHREANIGARAQHQRKGCSLSSACETAVRMGERRHPGVRSSLVKDCAVERSGRDQPKAGAWHGNSSNGSGSSTRRRRICAVPGAC
ncbi:conserved hypothetical protein [Citreicella sp. SE45]|nr:conserved hypothetical protein [Citreicella sp. SE45]